MTKILFLIPPENFRDEELVKIKKVLEKEGVETEVVSTAVGKAVGMLGAEEEVKKSVYEIKPKEYEALVIPGGIGISLISEDKKIHNLIKKFFDRKKPVVALSNGILLLIKADVLENKKISAQGIDEEVLKKKKLKLSENEIEIDENLITCSNPKKAEEVGKILLEMVVR